MKSNHFLKLSNNVLSVTMSNFHCSNPVMHSHHDKILFVTLEYKSWGEWTMKTGNIVTK